MTYENCSMSVTNPLIKELKEITLRLLEQNGVITDQENLVVLLCECLEKIFENGLVKKKHNLGYNRPLKSWQWIQKLRTEKIKYFNDSKIEFPYSFTSAVEAVSDCPKVTTSTGKLRLFIRYALVRRCIHVPIDVLIKNNISNHFYIEQSIIGDEILVQLFYSALLLIIKIEFKLQLQNSRFLDDSWVIPDSKELLLVPCKELGITVGFICDKAIVVNVRPNSVAEEDDNVQVGDVLDDLNDCCITSNMRGNLFQVLRKSAGAPVQLFVLKAKWNDSIYPPLIPLLRQVGLDPTVIQSQITGDSISPVPQELCPFDDRNKDNLFFVFVGSDDTQKYHDINQICTSIKKLVESNKQLNIPVIFEFQELGIKVLNKLTNEEIIVHSYLDISSCARTANPPHHFGFIASTCPTDPKKATNSYRCYIFHSVLRSQIDRVLKTMEQGFRRTMCTA